MLEVSENEGLVCAVNYEVSFRKERLIYKITFGSVLNSIMNYGFCLFILAGMILALFNIIIHIHDVIATLVACGIVVLGYWIIANFIWGDRFVKIEGTDIEGNKKIMLQLLGSLYPKINFLRA